MYRVESAYPNRLYRLRRDKWHHARDEIIVDQLGTTVLDMYLTHQTTTILTGVFYYQKCIAP